eukprot:PhF_6_TR22713/c0_g1_i1/m.32355/K05869/CAMK4; calcium/calmodulin-dependent protein kinase IV
MIKDIDTLCATIVVESNTSSTTHHHTNSSICDTIVVDKQQPNCNQDDEEDEDITSTLPLSEDILRKFKVHGVLGRGATAIVYKATSFTSTTSPPPLALKIYSDPAALQAEVEALRVIQGKPHPNVMHCEEIVPPRCLVVEACGGGELFHYVANSKDIDYTEEMVAKSLRGLLLAVQHLHSLNIAHRDIKPQNILLRYPGNPTEVVLVDFGIACTKGHACRGMLGTPGYIAPEALLAGAVYDKRCDLWSVGVVAYVLLTGRMPYYPAKGSPVNVATVLDATRNATPLCLEEYSWSSEAKQFVQRLLCVDPAQRYTAQEALSHPFITQLNGGHHVVAGDVQSTLRRFNARERLRAILFGVCAAQRAICLVKRRSELLVVNAKKRLREDDS